MADTPSAFGPSGLEALNAQTAEAAAALQALKAPAQDAAQAIDDAFAKAGTGLAGSLARAAADGKVTLEDLARAVISAVDAAAGLRSGGGGLASALGRAVGAAFSGARAGGGPVTPGGAFLVGEQGPEVFRPTSAGSVEPAGPGGGVIVNLNLQGADAPTLVRSEAQIAQALARAVSLGARRF